MVKGLLLSTLVLALAVMAGVYYDHTTSFTAPVPRLPQEWWGSGLPQNDDTQLKPFKIDFPDEVLVDLSQRLEKTKPFTPPLEGVGFEYGFNTHFLQTVLEFWKTKYSWKTRQAYLNSLPHFTTEIQGLKIHFIHAKPKNPSGLKVVPLLLVHGWPGSVREFYEMIPLLTTPRAGQQFVFEVIAPSLPGYGFSQAAARPGLGPAQIAVIFRTLMERIGFQQFVVQGGDWGSLIVTELSQLYPEQVVGLHSNMPFLMPTPGMMLKLAVGSVFPSLVCAENEEKLVYPVLGRYTFLLEESGYMHLQATKPDTAGVALRDSPMGLAAYILEKFSTWTNPAWKSLPDGGLLKKYKLEDLLDNIMIYWLTGTATTSFRLYSENFNKQQTSLGFDKAPVTVPTALARFPHELAHQPRSILELKYKNLVQVSDFPTGGHFAAFEEPQLLADDVWKFVSSLSLPQFSTGQQAPSEPPARQPKPKSQVVTSPPQPKPQPQVTTPPPEPKPQPQVVTSPPQPKPQPQVVTPPPQPKPQPQVVTSPPQPKPQPQIVTPPPESKPQPQVVTPPSEPKPKPQVVTPPPEPKPKPQVVTAPPQPKPKPQVATPPPQPKPKPQVKTPPSEPKPQETPPPKPATPTRG